MEVPVILFIFQLFLPKVAVMYLLGVLALGFYALKIPERYFPGSLCVVLYNSKNLASTYMYTVFLVFLSKRIITFW